METAKIINILGGRKIVRIKINNEFDLIRLTEGGLKKQALMNLAKWYGLPVNLLSEYVPLSLRTIQRYPVEKKLSRDVSEHIVQLAKVAARGMEVFEDRQLFLDWINQPNRSFAGKTPSELLKSNLGMEMVLDELGRIEQGIPY